TAKPFNDWLKVTVGAETRHPPLPSGGPGFGRGLFHFCSPPWRQSSRSRMFPHRGTAASRQVGLAHASAARSDFGAGSMDSRASTPTHFAALFLTTWVRYVSTSEAELRRSWPKCLTAI